MYGSKEANSQLARQTKFSGSPASSNFVQVRYLKWWLCPTKAIYPFQPLKKSFIICVLVFIF